MSPVNAFDYDPEQGLGHDSKQAVKLSTSSSNSSSSSDVEQRNKLRIFQDLVGIKTAPDILSPEVPLSQSIRLLRKDTIDLQHIGDGDKNQSKEGGRPKRSLKKLLFTRSTSNGGCYRRAIDEELKARVGFTISSVCINFIYTLQIFVAATITGISAYPNYGVELTVLGAMNTVLAGLMAYLKGQGLPNRLLKSRDQFHGVVEYIEYKERQFKTFAEMPPELQKQMDPWKEADKAEKLYLAAKKDQQDNYPDIYLNNHEQAAVTTINENNRQGAAPGVLTKEEIAKRIEDLKAMLDKLEEAKKA